MSGKKVVAVVGATGSQGGSVARALLADGTFAVRALVRDPSSDKAQQLAKEGAEVVQSDSNNVAQLEAAFAGVHGVFAFTAARTNEYEQGKNVADAAKATGVQHLVWSTLVDLAARSNGKYANPPLIEDKLKVQAYLEQIGVPSSFISPSSFLANYLKLTPNADGTGYDMIVHGSTKFTHFIDIEADCGAAVLGLLKHRDEWLGRVVALTITSSMDEVTAGAAAALGKPVTYIPIPLAVIPEALRPMITSIEEFGYYDPATDFAAAEKLVGRPLTRPAAFFARTLGRK